MINLETLQSNINQRLDKSHLSGNVLLPRVRLLSDSSRQSIAFCDSTYLPFYYYLGCEYNAKSVLLIGAKLGLPLCCYLQGSPDLDIGFCFNKKTTEFISGKIAIKNIRDFAKKAQLSLYIGSLDDGDFEKEAGRRDWDLAIIDEELDYHEMLKSMETAWQFLGLDALLVVDYLDRNEPSKEAFEHFSKIKNRKPFYIKSRYGVGLLQK